MTSHWNSPQGRKVLIFNMLQRNDSKGRNLLRKWAWAVLFCTKRFPQGFHSGPNIRKLRKPFRKDLFSGQNEDISDEGIGVT